MTSGDMQKTQNQEQYEDRAYRLKSFVDIILAPIVDITALRKLCWNGIPDKYRSLTWQLLIGYIPANASRRPSTLHRKRREYKAFAHQLSDLNDSIMTTHDRAVLRQVSADIPCMDENMAVTKNERVQFCLNRLLFTWAMRHPASSYVQGMKDMVTVLFVVFLDGRVDDKSVTDTSNAINEISDDVFDEVEADSYWCLERVLSGIQDHYTEDQKGIQRMIFRLEELIQMVNPELSTHFLREGVDIMHFSFKWMNCFLVRELPITHVMRVWDTYLSEEGNGFDDFHVYVCAVFLISFGEQLKEMEFEEMYYFLQNLPTEDITNADVESILSQAFVWRSMYGTRLDRIDISGPRSLSRRSSVNDPEIATNTAEKTSSLFNMKIDLGLLSSVDFLHY